jgi:deoxyribodipyrimidine photolyase
VWFRQDLRLRDNPALHAAARQGVPVVPAFVWCPEEEGSWPLGGAARYWLHQALTQLAASLAERYGRGVAYEHDTMHPVLLKKPTQGILSCRKIYSSTHPRRRLAPLIDRICII